MKISIKKVLALVLTLALVVTTLGQSVMAASSDLQKHMSTKEIEKIIRNNPKQVKADINYSKSLMTKNQSEYQAKSLAVGAIVASYYIPGVGQVLLLATGVVVVGGVVIVAGTWLYNVIKSWISSYEANQIARIERSIPKALKKPNSNEIDIKKFNRRGPLMPKGGRSLIGPLGYSIVRDIDNHKGSVWKLFDRALNRVASLSSSGKVVGK